MVKSTIAYWNPLDPAQSAQWQPIPDLETMIDRGIETLSAVRGLTLTPDPSPRTGEGSQNPS